jgi:hypothetical protein
MLAHPPLPLRQYSSQACIIDAEEGRDVAVIDIPNAFFQTKIEDEADMAIIKIRGGILAEMQPDVYKGWLAIVGSGVTLLHSPNTRH